MAESVFFKAVFLPDREVFELTVRDQTRLLTPDNFRRMVAYFRDASRVELADGQRRLRKSPTGREVSLNDFRLTLSTAEYRQMVRYLERVLEGYDLWDSKAKSDAPE